MAKYISNPFNHIPAVKLVTWADHYLLSYEKVCKLRVQRISCKLIRGSAVLCNFRRRNGAKTKLYGDRHSGLCQMLGAYPASERSRAGCAKIESRRSRRCKAVISADCGEKSKTGWTGSKVGKHRRRLRHDKDDSLLWPIYTA